MGREKGGGVLNIELVTIGELTRLSKQEAGVGDWLEMSSRHVDHLTGEILEAALPRLEDNRQERGEENTWDYSRYLVKMRVGGRKTSSPDGYFPFTFYLFQFLQLLYRK